MVDLGVVGGIARFAFNSAGSAEWLHLRDPLDRQWINWRGVRSTTHNKVVLEQAAYVFQRFNLCLEYVFNLCF